MRGGLLMIHPEDRGRETVRSAPNQTDPRTVMPDPKRAARPPAAPQHLLPHPGSEPNHRRFAPGLI